MTLARAHFCSSAQEGASERPQGIEGHTIDLWAKRGIHFCAGGKQTSGNINRFADMHDDALLVPHLQIYPWKPSLATCPRSAEVLCWGSVTPVAKVHEWATKDLSEEAEPERSRAN